MNRLVINLHSDVMDLHTEVTVLIPDMEAPEGGFPVLYLLHGKGGDHTDWTRLAPIEHYVRERSPMCVIMPEVQHSFYENMTCGLPYYEYISKELPEKLGRMLPLTKEREMTFTCGGSMGGYGAIMLALRQPERFGYAASISGALDVWEMIKTDEWPEWQWIFGDSNKFKGSQGDLLCLLQKDNQFKPHLFACCGLQDGLTLQNHNFVKKAKEEEYDITFVDENGGHDWHYRNRMIQKVLDWLPI